MCIRDRIYPRSERRLVLEALADTRVVMLLGARQVGKSTLARQIVEDEHVAQVVDLDRPAPRQAALTDQLTGKALESFVAMEIVKHAEWADEQARIHHYRRGSEEIDLILENRAGDIGAVEVKSSASLSARDWQPLARLRDAYGSRFRCGFLVHAGADTVPLGDRLYAVPLSGLWAA